MQGDALRCDLPAGDLVVYLYNPFDALLLGRFLEPPRRRSRPTAARFVIVYVNPHHRARLDAAGCYESISARPRVLRVPSGGTGTAAAASTPQERAVVSRPLISVIIPTYNRPAYVQQAVQSVLDQHGGFTFDIVVVDDGSTPETAAALRRFGDAIRVVRQDNAGLNPARNHGLELVTRRVRRVARRR